MPSTTDHSSVTSAGDGSVVLQPYTVPPDPAGSVGPASAGSAPGTAGSTTTCPSAARTAAS